jgi:hypothetical protein
MPNLIIEVGLLVVMAVGPGVVLWGRFRRRTKDDTSPSGLGARVLQLIGLLLLLPLIGILTLEGKLEGSTAGALLGVAAGYSLSGIEKAVPRNKSRTEKRSEPEKAK